MIAVMALMFYLI